MIVGEVSATNEAIVVGRVRGPSGRMIVLRSVILDTGFNDALTLSRSEIDLLQLEYAGEIFCQLADGTENPTRMFQAELEWLGLWREILVTELDGGPLLGMALLEGFRLTIDVTPGGSVHLEPLI